MGCSCKTLTEFALDCEPTIGGVKKVIFKGAGASEADVTVQTLPDTSSYNAVMTYDKNRNLKYWTTDVELNIGYLNVAAREFVENLPCPTGRTIELEMNSGHKVTISEAYIQNATFTPGKAKTEGGDGILKFQSITKDAPQVNDPA